MLTSRAEPRTIPLQSWPGLTLDPRGSAAPLWPSLVSRSAHGSLSRTAQVAGNGVRLGGMSFFDSIPQPPPPPEPVRRARPAWMQPDEVIPGSVPGEVMLIRTGQVAVTIGSVRAYPNGFEFTAHVRVRGEDENEPVWHDPFGRHGRRGEPPPGDVLRLGVMYADGRRAAINGGHWPPDEADPGRLVVQHGGSSGNARRWDGQFWVHPLPPEGPVTFVASWPEYGVAEARAELDGAAIVAAAARAVILWPEEPEFEPGGGAWSSGTITAYRPDESGSGAGPDQPGDEGHDDDLA